MHVRVCFVLWAFVHVLLLSLCLLLRLLIVFCVLCFVFGGGGFLCVCALVNGVALLLWHSSLHVRAGQGSDHERVVQEKRHKSTEVCPH